MQLHRRRTLDSLVTTLEPVHAPLNRIFTGDTTPLRALHIEHHKLARRRSLAQHRRPVDTLRDEAIRTREHAREVPYRRFRLRRHQDCRTGVHSVWSGPVRLLRCQRPPGTRRSRQQRMPSCPFARRQPLTIRLRPARLRPRTSARPTPHRHVRGSTLRRQGRSRARPRLCAGEATKLVFECDGAGPIARVVTPAILHDAPEPVWELTRKRGTCGTSARDDGPDNLRGVV